MNDHRTVRELLALRPADWSAAEKAQVERHLVTCPECAATARAYAHQDHLIGSLPAARLTPAQRAQLLARISQERKRHEMGNRLSIALGITATIAVIAAIVMSARTLLLQSSQPAPDALISPAPSLAPASAEEQPAIPSDEPTPLPPNEPALSSGDLPDLSPPAEGWIAFRTPEGFLTLVSPDGARSVLLTALGEVVDAFWSPDGRQLAVTLRSDDMIGAQLALVSLEDSSYITLTPPGMVEAREVVWSQDGRFLAYLWVMEPDAPRSPLALHLRDLSTGQVVTVTTYSNSLIPDSEVPSLSMPTLRTFPYPLLPVCMVALAVGCDPFEILDVRTGQTVADLGPVGSSGSVWLSQGKRLVIPRVEWEKEGIRVEEAEPGVIYPISIAVWRVGDETSTVILEGTKKQSYYPVQLLRDGRLVVRVEEWEKEHYNATYERVRPERVEYWLFRVDEAGRFQRIADDLPWWATTGFPAGFAQQDRVDNWQVGPDGETVVFELRQMEGEQFQTAIYLWRGEGEPIHLGLSDEMIFPQWQPR